MMTCETCKEQITWPGLQALQFDSALSGTVDQDSNKAVQLPLLLPLIIFFKVIDIKRRFYKDFKNYRKIEEEIG